MKSSSTNNHHTETLAAMLLFGVFAVCVLLVLFTGTRVYRRLSEQNSSNYYRRTCTQYLVTRVHNAERIETAPFGNGNAMLLREDIEGTEYVTYVYCYDGFLCELFTEYQEEAEPENGEAVIRADALDVEIENGLLKAELTAPDDQNTVRLILNVLDKEGGTHEE
jgi:hypothetical protein